MHQFKVYRLSLTFLLHSSFSTAEKWVDGIVDLTPILAVWQFGSFVNTRVNGRKARKLVTLSGKRGWAVSICRVKSPFHGWRMKLPLEELRY